MAEENRKIRTAAYCRVSTLMEIQESSYEMQTKYYTDLINSNPDMILVGVYGDRGRSGLSTLKRPGLKALLDDCRSGKIDYILCKSVSRFARNMADFVEMVRELRKLGVNIYFEKERIETANPGIDWILDTLAIIAEEESNSISLHLLESNAQHIKEGRPLGRPPYGYRRDREHVWSIYGEEAARVRRAFYMAGEVKSYGEIIDALDELEGKKVWTQGRLRSMLTNVAYKGDYYAYRTVTVAPGKCVVNKGLKDRYYLKGHHEAIVSGELFDKVQKNIAEHLLNTKVRKRAK